MVDLFDDGGGLQIRHKQIPNGKNSGRTLVKCYSQILNSSWNTFY